MNLQITKLMSQGRNDRVDEEDDLEADITIEDDLDDDFDPFAGQNDIIENPGDYDEDGERGYWAD